MKTIHVKKGWNIRLTGAPAPQCVTAPPPDRVAVLPERIPFIKPRLKVQEGDAVTAGAVLFEDKRRPELQFSAPGGGVIETIQFGPRRVIQEIVIRLDDQEGFREFEQFDTRRLAGARREEIVTALLAGGLWGLIRALPFRQIADPAHQPPAIYVSLDDQEPFHPQPAIYLKHHTEDLYHGLQALQKLAPKVTLFGRPASLGACGDAANVSGLELTAVSGAYPADDAGVLLYHTRTSPADNGTWFVAGQDVLMLGYLLRTGRYPTTRIISLAGTLNRPAHVLTRWGAPLNNLLKATGNASVVDGVRWVAGGVWRGTATHAGSYNGYYDTAVHLLPEGNQREFLGFVRPGYTRPSYSRAFLSVFNADPLTVHTNLGGGVRACVACGNCVRICPVDILPQLTYKAILAEDVEGYLALGLLDCVECGLCTYTCPAKIELDSTFKAVKAAYYREQKPS